MKVLTILARHGTERYGDAEERLAAIFASQLTAVERDVIVVDNALPYDTIVRSAGHVLLGGDNTHREFTAFDRAIAWIGDRLADYDLIHIATSAFNELYTAYLDRFTPPVLQVAAARSACVGHIDCYNAPVQVGPYVSQHWIRSCFFFLPPWQVRALGTFVSQRDGAGFFSGDCSSPFAVDAPVSATYRRYITDWLTGGDIGQGVTWHSAAALTPEALARFEFKALSIFNEHLLSIRLRAMGCPLLDVTWLSTLVGKVAADDIPVQLNWRKQLASRDRDAIVIAM
jgi:hypothetical protein